MNDTGGWRYVYASIPGVAHRASGVECQDACAVRWMTTPDGMPTLALAAADGAGSASRARIGAELACQTLLAECAAWLAQATVAAGTRAIAERMLECVQTALSQHAAATGLPVREFACTLLGAVLADDRALFLQIGDGAIVIGTGDDYRPVFWPQAGEYVNETYFVTDAGAAARLEFAALAEPVNEVALLTDGLQTLALHYQTRQAHAPFFRPLFQRLRAAAPEPAWPVALQTALERFLDTPVLNQRTHDDKTLILATRLAVMESEAVTTPFAESAGNTIAAPPDASTRPDPDPSPPAIPETHGDEAV